MNILSLFDGCSCVQVSLESLGFPVVNYVSSEIDKYAIKVTQHHFPNTIQAGDVTRLNFTQMVGFFDLLIGGSPCTNLSPAGNRKGLETGSYLEYIKLKNENHVFQGQSYLFWEYVRAVKEAQPKYFILENVVPTKVTQEIINRELGVIGFELNSNLFGAQSRKRMFWTNIPSKRFVDSNSQLTISSIKDLKEIPSLNLVDKELVYFEKSPGSKSGIHWLGGIRSLNSTWRGTNININLLKLSNTRQQQRLVSELGKHPTLLASGGNPYVLFKNGCIRRLNVLELERLQNLPDNYTEVRGVSNTQRKRMIGNGFDVKVIEHVLKGLRL